MESVPELVSIQSGVVSRRQLLARGATDSDIERMLHHRELTRIHDGVYVDHTGEPTWLQRAWAAVLFSAPAALTHESALRAADGPGSAEKGPLRVVVAPTRHLVAPPGVRILRGAGFADRVQWNASPPRVRYEEAALDVAAGLEDDLAAIAVLAKAVQSRRTTARRMLTALGKRQRIARRRFLRDVLEDVAEGTCSVLEHGYLHRVERAHRLPRAERQRTADGRTGRIYRDASYTGVEVELDGRLVHDTTQQRDRDFDRDLLTLADGAITARLSYGQVFARPCWTADQVARLLRERGWRGEPRSCGPECPLPG